MAAYRHGLLKRANGGGDGSLDGDHIIQGIQGDSFDLVIPAKLRVGVSEKLYFDVIDDQLQGTFRLASDGIRANPELMRQGRGIERGGGEKVEVNGKTVSESKGKRGTASESKTGGGRFFLKCEKDFEELQGNGAAVEHRKAEAGRSNQTRQNAKARGWSDLRPVTIPTKRLLP